ncbi:MAG: TRAP transporter substrate-binding protein [Rhodospirillaceae bacterium]|nr:TRAP transporter substrate-binding protein [Rhodospirillaceae bacterium]
MRNTIIGIVIGIVIGVMFGATVIAPGLRQARPNVVNHDGVNAENIGTAARYGQNGKSTTGFAGSDNSNKKSGFAGEVSPLNRIRTASSFPRDLPQLGEMAMRLEQLLGEVSNGTFDLKIYDPGVMVPVSDTFRAVQSGTLEAAFSSPGQWSDEIPALQLFSSIPFGPSIDEYLAWYYFGEGEQIFQSLLQKKGIHALVCGAIPTEASGWFRKPIRTIGDFKGLKIRAFGLGAKVLAQMGAEVSEISGEDIYKALNEGRLDGAEYSMPTVDAGLGLGRVAKNYYFPGWHQPSTLFSLMINAKTWDSLSPATQTQIETVCGDNVRFGLAQGGSGQFETLKRLGIEGVQVHRWPEIILSALHRAWFDVVREQSANDADFASTWNSIESFRRDYSIWQELSSF